MVHQEHIPIDLLITNGMLITMNETREIGRGDIAVQDNTILAMGRDLSMIYEPKQTINANGNAVLPGFINAHGHAPMVFFRGYGPDVPVQEWVSYYMFPLEQQYVNPDFVLWGTQLACLEMIASGTTTFVDSYYFEDQVAQAAHQLGMRAVVGQAIKDAASPDSNEARDALHNAEQLLKKWTGNDLIIPALAPHSIYTCSEDTLKQVAQLAADYNAFILLHCAETNHERAQHESVFVYLERLKLLEQKLLAAHCVHIDQPDMQLIKQYQVGVAHCPVSNMKLGSGIAPIIALKEEGVTAIGVGTDSPVSNNSLDMMAEIKVAALLQKVNNAAALFNAYDALELATIGGARSLRLDDQLGSLEVGKKADIIIVDLHALHQVPDYDPINQLVYASKSTDVISVIINGNLVYDQKQFAPSYHEQIKTIISMIQRFRV